MSRIIFFMVRAAYWLPGGPDSKNATRAGIPAHSLQGSRVRYLGHV
jgi:hypothetical protein